MSEMVERVAREIWGNANMNYPPQLREQVRDMLTVMRNPTAEMTRAGFDALPYTLADDQLKLPSKTVAVLDVWLAMIDAALKE
jgi:hypothetical protein